MAQVIDEACINDEPYDVPDGPTRRHKLLKMNYLLQKPSITIHRARIITQIDRKTLGCRVFFCGPGPSGAVVKPLLW